MSDEKAMVYVGRRAGAIIGTRRTRPTMMDVPSDERAQDSDIVFEALSGDHLEVVAFAARPMPPAGKRNSDRPY
jgi:hypothetical protein